MLRDETIRRVIQFRDDREWRQFHTPKDLAISLSLEAAELLEIFQWSGADLECRDKLGRIREELADVLSYCVLMADVCGLDLDVRRTPICCRSSATPVPVGYRNKTT